MLHYSIWHIWTMWKYKLTLEQHGGINPCIIYNSSVVVPFLLSSRYFTFWTCFLPIFRNCLHLRKKCNMRIQWTFPWQTWNVFPHTFQYRRFTLIRQVHRKPSWALSVELSFPQVFLFHHLVFFIAKLHFHH